MKEELEKQMEKELHQLDNDKLNNFYTWLQRAGVCFLLDEPDLSEQNDEEYRKFKEKHNIDKMKKEIKVKYKLKDMEDDFKWSSLVNKIFTSK